MPARYDRLVQPADIPDSLWASESDTLILPPALARSYCDSIRTHGLWAISQARSSTDAPVGGVTKAETDRHFAQAFSGSVARIELAVLDPKLEVVEAADAFVRLLAGGVVTLLDVPCGAAATSLSLLTTIAELRKLAVVPRIPLAVTIIGGEISDHARGYANELLDKVKAPLQDQGIQVAYQIRSWDACDCMSTTRLMQDFLQAATGSPSRLVVVANFSGFLSRAGKRRDAQRQIEEVLRYASSEDSSAIWIEPRTNSAIASGGIFDWIAGLVRNTWGKFAKLVSRDSSEGSPTRTTSARFRPPLNPDQEATVRLAVIRLDLREAR